MADPKRALAALVITLAVSGCTDPAKRFVVDLGPRYECSKGERKIDPVVGKIINIVPKIMSNPDIPEGEPPPAEVPASVLEFLAQCEKFLAGK